MIYKEEYCDVTEKVTEKVSEYVTAQCISEDCAMGEGVVLAFRKKFPGLKAACMEYIENIRTHNLTEYLSDNNLYVPYRHIDGRRVLYNMFTKKKYWYKAGKGMTYNQYLQNLEDSLFMVKAMMIANHEQKLAMPRIGCGLDCCQWSDVKKIILKVFSDTDFEILICYYR